MKNVSKKNRPTALMQIIVLFSITPCIVMADNANGSVLNGTISSTPKQINIHGAMDATAEIEKAYSDEGSI